MKMTDVVEGEVYRMVDVRGSRGTFVLKRKVRVITKGVTRGYNTRTDGVKVMLLKENENGELVDDTRYDDSPWERVILAREIIPEAEAQEREEAARLEREERERVQKIMREAREACEEETSKMVAMRLGISADHVRVSSMFDEETEAAFPYRATVEQTALEAMLEFDPDPELVAGAIQGHFKVPMNQQITATPAELAEIIVGALRQQQEDEQNGEDA